MKNVIINVQIMSRSQKEMKKVRVGLVLQDVGVLSSCL